MAKMLTSQQITAYEQDGFVAPVDIFAEHDAARLRAELERAEAKWPEAFSGAARNNAHYNFSVLDAIAHHDVLLDAVEDLIGPNVLNYGSVLFIKEPHDPGYVSWHQDARYMGLEPHAGVTAWIALSPSTVESGCMRMIPGSHLHEVHEHSDTFRDENLLTRGQQIDGVQEAGAVDLVLRPGQASFHHMRTVHSSNPNRSAARRIGFVIQCFIPPHVEQTKGRAYAQLARGVDERGHFEPAPRPARDMDPADVAFRDRVNAAWHEILYDGATRVRDL